MTEAEARKAASERGWKLEKKGKAFRLVDENGTVIAGDCSNPDGFYGLKLADLADLLER
jgi:hypothetical protein